MNKVIGRWPTGWFDGREIVPTFTYRTDEKGEQRYKLLSNGHLVLKVKRDKQYSVFYVWDTLDQYYTDAKIQQGIK